MACRYVELNNLNMFEEKKEFDAYVKLRYRTKAVRCHVKIENNHATVILKENVYGVAIGQAAVFYENNRILGGGWIEKV